MANTLRNGALGLAALVIALAPATIGRNIAINQAVAFEVNPNGYPIPNINGTLVESGYMDNNSEIPGKETYVERFNLPNGGKIARLSYQGEVYAYAIKESPTSQWYAIVAVPERGKFTHKYTGNEEFFVPQRLIDGLNR